ncbi:MAG: peptide deformylase [Desulfobacterales bacterium]|nr:peptide deformylase [Desulfobacterales bacterium]
MYRVCDPITQDKIHAIKPVVDVHDTMMAFRARYKAGRSIAAPQIGTTKRLIYMNIDQPVVLINPVLRGDAESHLKS